MEVDLCLYKKLNHVSEKERFQDFIGRGEWISKKIDLLLRSNKLIF